jgi:hypothetical protein
MAVTPASHQLSAAIRDLEGIRASCAETGARMRNHGESLANERLEIDNLGGNGLDCWVLE